MPNEPATPSEDKPTKPREDLPTREPEKSDTPPDVEPGSDADNTDETFRV